MERKLVLTAALLSTLWTGDAQVAVLVVLVKLRLTRKDAFAAFALEVVQLVMLLECCSTRPVKVTARFQTVFVHWIGCEYTVSSFPRD
jgi:hypothetical protein